MALSLTLSSYTESLKRKSGQRQGCLSPIELGYCGCRERETWNGEEATLDEDILKLLHEVETKRSTEENAVPTGYSVGINAATYYNWRTRLGGIIFRR